MAQQAGLPMPSVYIIENDQPNAFATGRNPENAAVAATTGLLRILSDKEVAGVMAHELAHVQNRDTLIMTITATIAGAISMLANFAFSAVARQPTGYRGNDPDHDPGAAGRHASAVGNSSREYAADRRGRDLRQSDVAHFGTRSLADAEPR